MSQNAKHYFQILTSSGVPIYRQILDQVRTHVASGRLIEGVFLPSVRNVSRELEVNPMTVSKAYSLLEKEGVVDAIRGKGMRVRGSESAQQDVQDREADIKPLIREVVAKAKQLSLDQEQLIDIVTEMWKEYKDE